MSQEDEKKQLNKEATPRRTERSHSIQSGTDRRFLQRVSPSNNRSRKQNNRNSRRSGQVISSRYNNNRSRNGNNRKRSNNKDKHSERRSTGRTSSKQQRKLQWSKKSTNNTRKKQSNEQRDQRTRSIESKTKEIGIEGDWRDLSEKSEKKRRNSDPSCNELPPMSPRFIRKQAQQSKSTEAPSISSGSGSTSEGSTASSRTHERCLTEEEFDKWLIPFGHIALRQELGSGAFGVVYKGRYRHTEVAIKVCNAVGTRRMEQFLAEAKIMVNIRPHPNVIQIFGVSIHESKPHIVLDFMRGGSLEMLLQKRALKFHEILDVLCGVASGMEHLHANNILHRDLAARNILLQDGRIFPKIADFGMSRLTDDSDYIKSQTGFGPIAWLAPEALQKRCYSSKSDVWSFGIMAWECVTRLSPAKQMDLLDLGIKIRDHAYTPTIPAETDAPLIDIMQLCWKQDPTARPTFANVCEFLLDTQDEVSAAQ